MSTFVNSLVSNIPTVVQGYVTGTLIGVNPIVTTVERVATHFLNDFVNEEAKKHHIHNNFHSQILPQETVDSTAALLTKTAVVGVVAVGFTFSGLAPVAFTTAKLATVACAVIGQAVAHYALHAGKDEIGHERTALFQSIVNNVSMAVVTAAVFEWNAAALAAIAAANVVAHHLQKLYASDFTKSVEQTFSGHSERLVTVFQWKELANAVKQSYNFAVISSIAVGALNVASKVNTLDDAKGLLAFSTFLAAASFISA